MIFSPKYFNKDKITDNYHHWKPNPRWTDLSSGFCSYQNIMIHYGPEQPSHLPQSGTKSASFWTLGPTKPVIVRKSEKFTFTQFM